MALGLIRTAHSSTPGGSKARQRPSSPRQRHASRWQPVRCPPSPHAPQSSSQRLRATKQGGRAPIYIRAPEFSNQHCHPASNASPPWIAVKWPIWGNFPKLTFPVHAIGRNPTRREARCRGENGNYLPE
ncbi:hypothetical protein GWL_30610 [Herbaspirillum sp. GW103]|nr:hypothetical protein GWL_30610 [Herbaspirillum sp. GW103]